MNAKEIRGKKVINLNDGLTLGLLDDLVFDFPKNTIRGIVVKDKKRELVIPYECIMTFGDEIIIVRMGKTDD